VKYLSLVFLCSVLIACSAAEQPVIAQDQAYIESTASPLQKLQTARLDYCSKYSGATVRKLAFLYLSIKYPLIDPDGICLGLSETDDFKKHMVTDQRDRPPDQ